MAEIWSTPRAQELHGPQKCPTSCGRQNFAGSNIFATKLCPLWLARPLGIFGAADMSFSGGKYCTLHFFCMSVMVVFSHNLITAIVQQFSYGWIRQLKNKVGSCLVSDLARVKAFYTRHQFWPLSKVRTYLYFETSIMMGLDKPQWLFHVDSHISISWILIKILTEVKV